VLRKEILMSSSSTRLPSPEGLGSVTDDMQSLVISRTGHFVAEQAPEEMAAALTEFLAPYREGGGGLR
jgi:hypothetical protein